MPIPKRRSRARLLQRRQSRCADGICTGRAGPFGCLEITFKNIYIHFLKIGTESFELYKQMVEVIG